MKIEKRRKSHLSTIGTARSVAGLFILSGFLLLIASAAAGTLLFQTDISGVDNTALLDSLTPIVETSADEQARTSDTDKPISTLKYISSVEKFKSVLRFSFNNLEWNHIWKLLIAGFIVMWFGYLLRVVTVLAETQLIDFQSVE